MSESTSLSHRLEHIETLLTFQQDTIEQIQAQLLQQMQQLDQLKKQYQYLRECVGSQPFSPDQSNGNDERPPHY